MKLEVSLNEAESDALRQVLNRHVRVLDKFEANQLVNVVRKVTAARQEVRDQQREAWRRFVWTRDDIAILRHGRGTPDQQASSDGRCTCECHAGGVSSRSDPGQAWCRECLADRARLRNSSLIDDA